MGFGHAVYRTDDPRSLMLPRGGPRPRQGPPRRAGRDHQAARSAELLDEAQARPPTQADVEFYAGVVMEQCGVPHEMFAPSFASSRVIGWCANVLEQAADDKIIRPSARYVGPVPPQPVPPLG